MADQTQAGTTRQKYLNRKAAIRLAIRMIKEAEADGQTDAHAMFGYRCERCKTLCFFSARNYAPHKGLCFNCNYIQSVRKLTFKILVRVNQREAMYDLVRKDREPLPGGDSGREDRSSAISPARFGSRSDRSVDVDSDSGTGRIPDSDPSTGS